jgi:hypothetical protein
MTDGNSKKRKAFRETIIALSTGKRKKKTKKREELLT